VDLASSSSNTTEGIYDTVLCLSVVKWIHLNEGDAGLLDFFHRLFHLLRVNGRLVLEFQPWKSYINNKGVNEKIKANFSSILIRPEQFESILVQQVGFVLEANLGPDLEQAKGFQRPIFVLRRPDTGSTNNSGSVGDTDMMEVESINGSCGSGGVSGAVDRSLSVHLAMDSVGSSSVVSSAARHGAKTEREEEQQQQIEMEEGDGGGKIEEAGQSRTKKRRVSRNER
jgi:hypothetical protein